MWDEMLREEMSRRERGIATDGGYGAAASAAVVGDDGEELAGDLPEASSLVHCPYCGEPCELLLDPGGAGEQEYVEDCEVCCRPWTVRVRWSGGFADVSVRREDEAVY